MLFFNQPLSIALCETAPKYIFGRRETIVGRILSISDVIKISSELDGGSSVILSRAFCASVVSSSALSTISVRRALVFGFCHKNVFTSRAASMPIESRSHSVEHLHKCEVDDLYVLQNLLMVSFNASWFEHPFLQIMPKRGSDGPFSHHRRPTKI